MAAAAAAPAGDPRFYRRAGPFRLEALAKAADADIAMPVAADAATDAAGREFRAVAPLQVAGPDEVSFLDNRRYLPALRETRAGAVILHPGMREALPAGCVGLLTTEPYAGWARACRLFHPPALPAPGIHPSAVVDNAARIGAGCEIGPLAVIGAGAEIGDGCLIGAGVVIGPGVVLGAGCRIGPQVGISHAEIGARVNILPGARIGQDGFGFAVTARGFLPVPQLGRVLIGDDVDIGANTTIDRGSAGDTVIGAGSRLDNLVQIAHNVQIGRMCVIVAQVGISGSTVLEDFVMIGGQAGLAGHVRVGAKAQIGAQAGVISDVPAGSRLVGSPALPAVEFWRLTALLRRLGKRPRAQGKETDAGP